MCGFQLKGYEDWMRRTKMLRARRSRSKWIIIFRTGEDTGQRLRNSVAECFTIDAFFDDLLLSFVDF